MNNEISVLSLSLLATPSRKEERTGLIFAAPSEGGMRLKPLTSGRAD